MLTSIIVPVAKEGEDLYDRISTLSKGIMAISEGSDNTFEFIIVTDMYHKTTLKALAKLSKDGMAMSLLLTKRIGKGGSIKNAVRYAKGKYIVLLDADTPVPPKTIVNAVRLADKKEIDLLIANRVYRSHGSLRKFLSTAYNTLVDILFRTRLKDHQAGFKVLSNRVAKIILSGRTRTDGLAYDTEIIVWIKKHKRKHATINVIWQEKRDGSNIPPIRALLTMLADLIMLRFLTIGNRYTALHRTVIGKIIDLKTFSIIGPEFMTIIKAGGITEKILSVLRKLYLAVAFKK